MPPVFSGLFAAIKYINMKNTKYENRNLESKVDGGARNGVVLDEPRRKKFGCQCAQARSVEVTIGSI